MPLHISDQQSQIRKVERAMELLPVELPDRGIASLLMHRVAKCALRDELLSAAAKFCRVDRGW